MNKKVQKCNLKWQNNWPPLLQSGVIYIEVEVALISIPFEKQSNLVNVTY